jgi:hypothetical protein
VSDKVEQTFEKFEIKFEGGLASEGSLHFYEYSRSQYGISRLISVVEYYRRNRSILKKVTPKNYVEMIVTAPKKGSFVEDILILLAQEAVLGAISVPFSVFLNYIWGLIFPRSDKTDQQLVKIAEIGLEVRRQDAKQAALFTDVVKSGQATTNQALELVKYAMSSQQQSFADAGLDQETLQLIRDEVREEMRRQKEVAPYHTELENCDSEEIAKLTSRIRPIIHHIALPLRKSAKTVSFSVGGGEPMVKIDKERALTAEGRTVDDTNSIIRCHVKSFDRDNGTGKLISDEFDRRQMTFVVPLGARKLLTAQVLDAMTRDKIDMVANIVRDKSGQPTSLVMIDALPVETD